MKRKTFRATVVTPDFSRIIGERDTFAWNSAIRATEDIVREFAREPGNGAHTGSRPEVLDEEGARVYGRTWTSPSGRELRALVWEVAA